MTIAIEGLGLTDPGPGPAPRPHRRFTLKRILIAAGALLGTLLLLTGSFDRHQPLPHRSRRAPRRGPRLAAGQGQERPPGHRQGPRSQPSRSSSSTTPARHTNILQIPQALGLPLKNGSTVPLGTLSLHAPSAIIAGLDRLGIPVTHYVGVDLHTVNPHSNLAKLANGTMALGSLMSNPAGASSLLTQVASHICLGPGHTGLRRPVPHERAHGPPRLRSDRAGRARHRRADRRLRQRPASLLVVVVATG